MGNKGKLIIFEGSDATGKSTLSTAFCSLLPQIDGVPQLLSFPGKERGTLGEWVYRLHHSSHEFGVESMSPASLQALHIAAHLDSIERIILPALESGKFIVLDRFWWSTWVYGTVNGVSRDVLTALIDTEKKAWGNWLPTIAFYVNRKVPLRNEPIERWHQLNATYIDLIVKEKENHLVHMLSNDGEVVDSLKEALAIAAIELY